MLRPVLTKYMLAVWAAPSESYTVSEVDWLKLVESAGLKAVAGGVSSEGRL